jgi:hypothetical protein
MIRDHKSVNWENDERMARVLENLDDISVQDCNQVMELLNCTSDVNAQGTAWRQILRAIRQFRKSAWAVIKSERTADFEYAMNTPEGKILACVDELILALQNQDRALDPLFASCEIKGKPNLSKYLQDTKALPQKF